MKKSNARGQITDLIWIKGPTHHGAPKFLLVQVQVQVQVQPSAALFWPRANGNHPWELSSPLPFLFLSAYYCLLQEINNDD